MGLLIRFGRQHGYSLKQFISREIADFAKIKLPTIYYNLEKMKEKGYVTAITDKDGNRPEKTVYEITQAGRSYFNILMKEVIGEEFQAEFKVDGVLYFIDLIDNEYLMNSLDKRRNEILKQIEALKTHRELANSHVPNDAVFLAEKIFDHHLYHMEAELKWLEELLKGLSKD